MNYEELYQNLAQKLDQLQNALSMAKKAEKGLDKDLENGDLEDLISCSQKLEEAGKLLHDAAIETTKEASAFDGNAYISSGDYAAQMLAYFKEDNIDVAGEYPVYEIFPCRVKLDAENQEVIIDKKHYSCLRPKKLVEIVKANQERLNKAPFNASSFVNELYEAYGVALLKGKKTEGADIYLSVLYKLMAPMARARKEYDAQSFAFDLARLYQVRDEISTKDGSRLQFGSSRNANKAIRILDANGNEQFLCTVSFYK